MEKRRGIRSLIPTGTLSEEPEERAREVAIGSIHPSPRQPRQKLDEEGLAELADSIRAHGIMQPLVVRPQGAGRYELIAGQRRLMAARQAGLQTVPVVVREASDQEALAMALVENLQREDINPMDAAESYSRLMSEFGMTQERIAAAVGKSRAAVANTLRLLRLPEPIQESLRRGEIEEGHAKVLAGVPEPARALRIWRRIVRSGVSVKGLVEMVARQAGRDVPRGTILGRPKKSSPPLDPNLADLERRLMQKLGARVTLRPRAGRRGGVIEIQYADQEELDRLFWELVS